MGLTKKKFYGQGWRRKDRPCGIYVGSLPGRKKIALYEDNGEVTNVLAYFIDEESARRCLEILDEFIICTEQKAESGI